MRGGDWLEHPIIFVFFQFCVHCVLEIHVYSTHQLACCLILIVDIFLLYSHLDSLRHGTRALARKVPGTWTFAI